MRQLERGDDVKECTIILRALATVEQEGTLVRLTAGLPRTADEVESAMAGR